ncbi:hypothetical protein CALVIDRAFT_539282, partial [Calocera viscosa TUFC12733]
HVTAYIVNGEVIDRDSIRTTACETAGVIATWRAHPASGSTEHHCSSGAVRRSMPSLVRYTR